MTAQISLIEQGPLAGAHKVHVEIAPQPKDYDIIVNEHLLAEAGGAIRERLGLRRCIVVTDQSIAPLYLKKIEASLAAAGHNVQPSIVIPPGEAAKSLPGIHELSNNLFERMVDRKTLLVAMGGGVIGDLTGFAAAIILRGLDFIQIPTTLLAQVDSSVGGKTGINSIFGKNTVGAFHQPRLVLADVSTLESLSSREMKSGYAEIVKYGLIQDASFFEWCQANGKKLLSGDAATRIQAICKSCECKAQIVAEDECEAGKRALLNLGHTFAHALESVNGYGGALLHGEAVAMGTVLAFRLSAEMGLCSPDAAEAVFSHFQDMGVPLKPPPMSYEIEQLMAFMEQDKKARDGKLTLILARGIGECFIAKEVDPTPVRALWRKFLG